MKKLLAKTFTVLMSLLLPLTTLFSQLSYGATQADPKDQSQNAERAGGNIIGVRS